MKLLRVIIDPKDKGKLTAHWLAIWKTPKGNFIHDRLPFSDQEPQAEAEAYAQAHVPVWS